MVLYVADSVSAMQVVYGILRLVFLNSYLVMLISQDLLTS